MALDARFVLGLEVEEVLEFSAVRAVAARALQGDVGIPGVDDLFTDRVRRMGLPLVAFRAEFDRRGFVCQERIVGSMWSVTFIALPFRDRRVARP